MNKRRKLYDLQNSNFIPQEGWNSCTVENSTVSKFSVTPYLPLLLSMLSGCFFCLLNVFVKKLTYISVGELSLVRSLATLAFTTPILVWCGKDIMATKQHRCLLMFRGFLLSTALYLLMLGYRYLPLAEAATIISITPAVVFISARFYLKEPIDFVQAFALVITVTGMLISTRVPELFSNRDDIQFNFTYLAGIVSSLGGVLFISISYVLIRKMKEIHFSVMLFHAAWTGAIFNTILTCLFESYSMTRCGWDRLQTLLVGVLAFFGQICIVLACQTELAGVAATMRSAFEIVFAVAFQVAFFASIPDMYNTIGAFLVLVALLILTLRTWFLSLPKDTRSQLKIISVRIISESLLIST